MRMLGDWIRIRLVDRPRGADLALPEGYERNVQDEDTLFMVLETGPAVNNVRTGHIIVCSFMSGMFRFKLPDDDFKSFAIREGDVLGIVTPNEVKPKIQQGGSDDRIGLIGT